MFKNFFFFFQTNLLLYLIKRFENYNMRYCVLLPTQAFINTKHKLKYFFSMLYDNMTNI